MTDIVFRRRLFNVARSLRETTLPKAFNMDRFTYVNSTLFPCDTPMCALGHYAARRDLQDAFYITSSGILKARGPRDLNIFWEAESHFAMTCSEVEMLFNSSGCGGAKTAEAAACYIEDFADRKFPVSA